MRLVTIMTAVALICLQLVSGAAALAGEPETNPAGSAALVAGNNEFAFDMYDKLSAKDNNIFYSPFSISAALAMTYAGAGGNTEKQMADVLHFGLPQDELHAAFALLTDKVKAAGAKDCRLEIANALWGQRNYSFLADFLAVAQKYYGGRLSAVDFADSESGRIINNWVEKNTAGKIKDLLQPGDTDELTRLVLTNAIYFKGDWAAKFDKEQTRTASFYVRQGETVDVSLMSQTGRFAYAAADGWQALEMPYAGGELAMVIILPPNSDREPGAKISAAKLDELLGRMREREVAVSIPKFKFETRYNLAAVLSQMGMTDAFKLPPADFSGMTGGKNLYITGVIHQAVIEVNEEGSEAAAATAVVMGVKSVMTQIPEFKADRPFTFLIRHKPTGSILFMGRVVNPASK